MQFPVQAPRLGGLFREGFGQERGNAEAAPNKVSAGAGRAGGASCAGAAHGEGARPGGAAAGPGRSPLAHLLADGGLATRPLQPGPPLLRRLGKGGGEAPAASLCLAFPEKGPREDQTPPQGTDTQVPSERGPPRGGQAEMPLRGGEA